MYPVRPDSAPPRGLFRVIFAPLASIDESATNLEGRDAMLRGICVVEGELDMDPVVLESIRDAAIVLFWASSLRCSL